MNSQKPFPKQQSLKSIGIAGSEEDVQKKGKDSREVKDDEPREVKASEFAHPFASALGVPLSQGNLSSCRDPRPDMTLEHSHNSTIDTSTAQPPIVQQSEENKSVTSPTMPLPPVAMEPKTKITTVGLAVNFSGPKPPPPWPTSPTAPTSPAIFARCPFPAGEKPASVRKPFTRAPKSPNKPKSTSSRSSKKSHPRTPEQRKKAFAKVEKVANSKQTKSVPTATVEHPKSPTPTVPLQATTMPPIAEQTGEGTIKEGTPTGADSEQPQGAAIQSVAQMTTESSPGTASEQAAAGEDSSPSTTALATAAELLSSEPAPPLQAPEPIFVETSPAETIEQSVHVELFSQTSTKTSRPSSVISDRSTKSERTKSPPPAQQTGNQQTKGGENKKKFAKVEKMTAKQRKSTPRQVRNPLGEGQGSKTFANPRLSTDERAACKLAEVAPFFN